MPAELLKRLDIKRTYWIAMLTGAAVLSAVLMAPVLSPGQALDDKAKAKAAAKAKQNAKTFDDNATVISLYGRDGKKLGTVGERALYSGEPLLSPDGTRVAVFKGDQESGQQDLWVVDAATGKTTRIATTETSYRGLAVWSPDGSQLAYMSFRDGTEGVYRRASTGEGPEELLYKNPGAGISDWGLQLSDWSMDGRFLSFSASDLTGSALYILPLSGPGERQPIEVFRSKESRLSEPRFSPDGRFLSYTQPSDRGSEVFVRPTDATAGLGSWQVSDGGGSSSAWRRDGRELYYRGSGGVMAVEVGTSPTFTFAKPKLLFRQQGLSIRGASSDGEIFPARPPVTRPPVVQQITIFDREGKVVSKVGEPGRYSDPVFSPDGKRLAVYDRGPRTIKIWSIDIATGKETAVSQQGIWPMWSPDGRQILYIGFQRGYPGVYRKASDGTGEEELLFRYDTPGASLYLTDVSPDGKFVLCASGGVLLVVPITGTNPPAGKAIEFLRDEFDDLSGRFSPDERFIAYASDEADPERFEVYVRPFDASTGMPGKGKWQLSKDGVAGANAGSGKGGSVPDMQFWRGDGKEFFFSGLNEETDDFLMMSAEASTAPSFRSAAPTLLFRLPGPLHGNFGNISRDGERFVFAVDVPATAAPKESDPR